MDVRIEAAAMTATLKVRIFDPLVRAVKFHVSKAYSPVGVVASFSRLSIGGTSLNAVSPDSQIFGRTLALGVSA